MTKTNETTNTAANAAATQADDDPVGACQFTNAAGKLVCIDNMKKSECDQIAGSIFIEGGSCQ